MVFDFIFYCVALHTLYLKFGKAVSKTFNSEKCPIYLYIALQFLDFIHWITKIHWIRDSREPVVLKLIFYLRDSATQEYG